MKKITETKAIKTFLSLNKNQKIIFASLFVILFACIIAVFVKSCAPKTSSVIFVMENDSEYSERIHFLNKSARKSFVDNGETAFYKFSSSIREQIENFRQNNEGTSLVLRMISEPLDKTQDSVQHKVTYGFLNENNITSQEMMNDAKNGRTASLIVDGIVSSSEKTFDLALAIEKNPKTQVPMGFFVTANFPVEIISVTAAVSKIGYDKTINIPFFGVSSNGGFINSLSSDFDFTGASECFPKMNTKDKIMPVISVKFSNLSDYGTSESPVTAILSAGGQRLLFYRTPEIDDYIIQTSLLKTPYSNYNVTRGENSIVKLLMEFNDSELIGSNTVPLKTDLGFITKSEMNNWRDPEYELYEWNRYPGVLFFDTRDYDVQSKFFTRLAFFAEKKGFVGQILTDQQIGNLHGYNAHDYRCETLADFFNKAEPRNVLNAHEKLLCEILLKNGVIKKGPNGYEPGRGSVISISQESQNGLRQTFVAHESFHVVFFNDENFQNVTSAVYYTIDPTSLKFLTEYWQTQPGLSYDPNDEYLMRNEFMAYIIQQPLNGIAKYFVHLANRGSVMKAIPDLCDYVKKTEGKTFEDAGKIFESFLFDNYGLASGRVHYITPLN